MKDPKIAIGYSYLNSQYEHARSLDPWYNRPEVKYIIALNGRYRTPLPPSIRAKYTSKYSTDNSEHLLKTRYADKIIHENLYATQMDKRQRYLDLAGELGCDYLIVWDTDDFIHPEYTDFDLFFKQLDATDRLWPNERIFYMFAWIPDEKLWSKQYNEIASNIWRQYSRVHKNPGTQRYAQSHWTFADKSHTDDIINKWKWKYDNRMMDEVKDNPYYIQSNVTLDGIRFTTDRVLRKTSDLEFGNSWTFQQLHYESFTYKLCPYLKMKGISCIGMDLPMEKYYFKPAGFVGDEEVGQIVLIEEDGKEKITHQEFNIDTATSDASITPEV